METFSNPPAERVPRSAALLNPERLFTKVARQRRSCCSHSGEPKSKCCMVGWLLDEAEDERKSEGDSAACANRPSYDADNVQHVEKTKEKWNDENAHDCDRQE